MGDSDCGICLNTANQTARYTCCLGELGDETRDQLTGRELCHVPLRRATLSDHGRNQGISLGQQNITTLGVYEILNQVENQSRLRGSLHFTMHYPFTLFHFILLANHLPSDYLCLTSEFIQETHPAFLWAACHARWRRGYWRHGRVMLSFRLTRAFTNARWMQLRWVVISIVTSRCCNTLAPSPCAGPSLISRTVSSTPAWDIISS